MTEPNQEIDRIRTLVGSERDQGGQAFATLANALLEAGRPTDAHDVVEAGRALHPEFATGHLVAGLIDLALAAREPARAAFRRVLQLDPDNRVALRAIAQLYEEDGEPREALTYLVPLAQIEPEDITLHERIVRLQASEAAGAVASELPADPEPPADLDASALLFSDEEPAASAVEPDVSEASVEDLADDALAWVQERGRDEVPSAEEAPMVTRTMAEVLADQGQYGESIQMYEQLLEATPDDQELKDAIDELRAKAESAGSETVPQEPPATRRTGAAAPEVRDYFEELLAAQGDAPVLGPELLSEPADPMPALDEAFPKDVVPVADLGPAPTTTESLAPSTAEPSVQAESDAASAVPVESLAPPATPVEALAPDAVPVAELGPDAVPVAELGPDPVDIADLASEADPPDGSGGAAG